MNNNTFLYLARFLSACCIYLFISKANVWLDRLDNTILVLGYRFFIILAPLFFLISKRWIGFFSFLTCTIGILLWVVQINFIGTILFTSGIAVGSYVIKCFAVKTPKGAANNAIIFNAGVFFSGFILIYFHYNNGFLILGLGFMLIALACSLFIGNTKSENTLHVKEDFSFSGLKSVRGISWALIGLVSGIEMISMFSILPQYLISINNNILPAWYGWVLPVSSLTVVLLQGAIMNRMKKLDLNQTIGVVAISMVVVSFPSLFLSQYFWGAMIWVFIITLFECAIGYLDTLAALDGGLLIKETFVGLGASATVFLARTIMPLKAAIFIGMTGFLIMLILMYVLKKEEKFLVKTI